MNMGVRIVDVLASAFRSAEGNWQTWLKVILAPLFLIVMCRVAVGFISHTDFTLLASLITGLLSFLFGMILSVNIYRYGILNEHSKSWLSLRFDRPVWMVALYSLLLYVILAAIVGIIGAVYFVFEDVGITTGVGGLAGLIVLYFSLRLSLLIPAVAIGLEKPLRHSFHITKGNLVFIFMTLFTLFTTYICVFLVTAIPFGIAAAVLSLSFFIDESIAVGAMSILGFIYFATCYLYIIAVSGKAISNIYMDCKQNS